MPNSGKDPFKEHLEARIPGAIFFDHDEICDKSINMPHTLPSLQVFTENMRKLGIQKNHDIVCYDN
jgi:thiosulfate/3-mercaptopyruvate sulfurtransferase